MNQYSTGAVQTWLNRSGCHLGCWVCLAVGPWKHVLDGGPVPATICHELCKATELTEMPFGLSARMGSRNHVILDGVRDPYGVDSLNLFMRHRICRPNTGRMTTANFIMHVCFEPQLDVTQNLEIGMVRITMFFLVPSLGCSHPILSKVFQVRKWVPCHQSPFTNASLCCLLLI